MFEAEEGFSCCCFGFWEEEELYCFVIERKKRNLGKEIVDFGKNNLISFLVSFL